MSWARCLASPGPAGKHCFRKITPFPVDVVWGCFFLDLASFTSGNYAPFQCKVPKEGFVSGGAALVSGGLGNSGGAERSDEHRQRLLPESSLCPTLD